MGPFQCIPAVAAFGHFFLALRIGKHILDAFFAEGMICDINIFFSFCLVISSEQYKVSLTANCVSLIGLIRLGR